MANYIEMKVKLGTTGLKEAVDLSSQFNNNMQAGAAAAVRREQPTQHSDGGGLAAAVGAEKTADAARHDAQVDVVDHGAGAVALHQPPDVDGGRRHCKGSTSMGRPGRNCVSGASGRASTR